MAAVLLFERDRAYERLLDLILTAELDPERPLSERKLAEVLDMGRTPVREAIRRLTREGLVEVRPARGTYVRQLNRHDVEEIYEARTAIEGAAAALAAQRGPTLEFPRFRESFMAMIESPESFELSEIHELGQAFHVEVFKAARNRFLLENYELLRLKHQVALKLPRLYDHTWVIASVREHLDILIAIESGDADKARATICAHLDQGVQVRSRIFDEIIEPQLRERSRRAAS